MNAIDEPKESNPITSHMVQPVQSKKYPIICKFWMMGNCIKDTKCDYMHTERDKNSYSMGFNQNQECPMFKFGFCKNGSMCTYKHIRESKSESELDKMELVFRIYFWKTLEFNFRGI
jgi:hypothetical protein